jgi:hypothetical protein
LYLLLPFAFTFQCYKFFPSLLFSYHQHFWSIVLPFRSNIYKFSYLLLFFIYWHLQCILPCLFTILFLNTSFFLFLQFLYLYTSNLSCLSRFTLFQLSFNLPLHSVYLNFHLFAPFKLWLNQSFLFTFLPSYNNTSWFQSFASCLLFFFYFIDPICNLNWFFLNLCLLFSPFSFHVLAFTISISINCFFIFLPIWFTADLF